MAKDLLKVKLGTCKVTADGTDLGHTIGGVEVSYAPEYQETKVDDYAGITERWLTGEKLSAKVPLAQNTLENINVAITHSTLNGTDYVTFGSKAGKRSSENAMRIVLHPIANDDADLSDDLTIFKAHVINEITIPYKNDGEQIIAVEFGALVDETSGDGALLGMFGDSL